ncbi:MULTISPECIES: 2'-5' RNA ligase family protein [unclassified Haloarcula]|uniref:2'-5' RNA ligase family protein n=1 Tax=unclassified Haloarcula TaxID=2624677 RepID=UPI000EF139E3|nr:MULTISPECIES: 2'-5' RNA ligase family protein [unclassified Haloarcula]RLM48124.1 2'-5' RNA ligase family protein [Haloarcula sp. Atlit-47R]RLM96523.1 2'-5' RNA ligase family protein [Haloarcula sp. Atlit-7R]
MYSINVPLPSAVTSLAADLAADLPLAQRRGRGEHTLVAKRLGDGDHAAYARLEAQGREVLRGQPAFEAEISEIEQFETAATGPSPVVYLAVESPGLVGLHERLCERFDPVDEMEGDEYVPHVTVARGGDRDAAARLVEQGIDPIRWTVDELTFYDADRNQPVSRVSLPA